jgi:hypothetical protein
MVKLKIVTSESLHQESLQEKGHQASTPTYTAIKGQTIILSSEISVLDN